MTALLVALSWPEWRAHPWRQGVALLAVALGVALAFSVQLINGSALDEFGSAVRSINGTPDVELRAVQGPAFGGAGFDEALYARVAAHPLVQAASPVVEASAVVAGAGGRRVPLRVLGVDALVVAAIAPDLLPRPAEDAPRLSAVEPGHVFLNAAAREQLGDAAVLMLPTARGALPLQRAGSVAASGPPLAVVDIADAQALFGLLGRLNRIDLRLRPGADPAALASTLQLPPDVRLARPDEAQARMANLSRAYRVNLTVLALVALFTGGFLVFSVMALAVARRVPQFALLGVLGLAARERRRLVLAEGALLGAAGSALGLLLGSALAAAALRWLGGDLGGGYFQGLSPRLHWRPEAALVYGALGIAAALVGAWVPARQAERLAPAQALKGLGLDAVRHAPPWLGPALLLLAAGLSLLPPIAGLPVAAYLGVACALVGGIACVPGAVNALVRLLPPPRGALMLLAVERARAQRAQASVAVAGVVASLSLGVALTVMVGSFRDAVDGWLQQLLPADLYLHSAPGSGVESAVLPPGLAASAAAVSGVARVQAQRALPLTLDARRPAVLLLARPLPEASRLPTVGPVLEAPPGMTGVFASEALASLYGAQPGRQLQLPLGPQGHTEVFVRGVWRDYARQHGSLLMPLDAYRRLTGDREVTDLALWLSPGAPVAAVQQALRAAAAPAALEMATTAELRAFSLRLFDRSFAVTTYLQAVAIAIGLFGIAASFSAQVLARRKEFGMLAHLGFTRAQVVALVAGEGAVWTGAGALLGLALGLAVSVVLVHVVNPQSFHWTMEMAVPWARLAALCAAVLAAGTLTAALAGRAAGGRQMALAVKEDW
jgi:putative ABC transport system permease protein